jgi:hypothetical protein
LHKLSSPGRRRLRIGMLTPQKLLSNEELLILLRRQITFDRDQKGTAIDQTTGGDGRVDHDRLFGLHRLAATELHNVHFFSWLHLISVVFKNPVLSHRNNNLFPKYHSINLLEPIGYVMHQQFNIQQLYALPTL